MKEKLRTEILARMQYLDQKDREQLSNVIIVVLQDYEVTQAKNEVVEYSLDGNYKLLQQFLMAKMVEGCTKRTIDYYKMVDKHFLDFINMPLIEITADHIRYYLASRAMTDKVSKSTQNNELRCLRSLFAWLNAEDFIPKNPCLKIKAIKQEKRVKTAYTELEIERMRKACKDKKRELALLDVMYSTGCRVGEIVGMNREDLKGDEIVVFGKGEKERIVFLNARAQESLNDYLESRGDDNEAMFVSRQKPNNRIQINCIQHAIREIGHKAGVKKSHPHKMRRTTATMALQRGMAIEEVQKMLGHCNISTTTIYAQASMAAVKADHLKYVV